VLVGYAGSLAVILTPPTVAIVTAVFQDKVFPVFVNVYVVSVNFASLGTLAPKVYVQADGIPFKK